MKRIMWAISVISLAGTAVVLQFMPEKVPMHYDLAGNIDRWGSKYENLIFPVIILLMSLFWTLFMGYFEKKALNAPDGKESADAKTNVKVFGIVGVSMAAVFTVIQVFILHGAYTVSVSGETSPEFDIGKLSVVMMGVLFIILGNYMTKTRINSIIGLRISWSMYNDNTWRKSNRFSAFALVISGILTVILAVVVKSFFAAIICALGILTVVLIISVIYAHKVYVRELNSEKGES